MWIPCKIPNATAWRLIPAIIVMIGAGLAAVVATGATAQAEDGCPDRQCLEELVGRIQQSVVGIGTFKAIRQPQSQLIGSGFAIGDGRTLLTNYHVIEDHLAPKGNEYLVALLGRGKMVDVREVEILQTDENYDLALLSFDDGEPLPPLELESGGNMAGAGRQIAITGFPLGPVYGLYPVTHSGIVAAVTPNKAPLGNSRHLTAEVIRRARFDVYQLDLTAYPGNSGSPLYDARTGKVLGIVNSTYVKDTRESALSSPSGISFAIPAKYIRLLLYRLNNEEEN